MLYLRPLRLMFEYRSDRLGSQNLKYKRDFFLFEFDCIILKLGSVNTVRKTSFQIIEVCSISTLPFVKNYTKLRIIIFTEIPQNPVSNAGSA